MLPVMMKPLIHYQLKLLEGAGFQGEVTTKCPFYILHSTLHLLKRCCADIIIVTIKPFEAAIRSYIVTHGFGQYAASDGLSKTSLAEGDRMSCNGGVNIQVKTVEEGQGTAEAIREIKGYLKVYLLPMRILRS